MVLVRFAPFPSKISNVVPEYIIIFSKAIQGELEPHRPDHGPDTIFQFL
jgi:hypothetical protein